MRKANEKGIVIKREEIVEGEGHGGAWKVAYADFVTAMMAFFLLMWLLNATTEDQRKGLADYFSPNSMLSHASSGTGDPFGGHTAFDSGALVSDRGAVQVIVGTRPTSPEAADADAQPAPPEHGDGDGGPDQGDQTGARGPRSPDGQPQSAQTADTAAGTPPPAAPGQAVTAGRAPGSASLPTGASAAASAGAQTAPGSAPNAANGSAATQAGTPRAPTDAEIAEAQQRRETAAFARAAQAIRDAVRGDPALAELANQLAIEMTPEGLRIQILDEENRSMFDLGSAAPNDRVRALMEKVTPILAKLPEAISIAGYTDATPFPGPDRTNWELSTERANAARRLLVDDGLPETRIRNVTGHADRDPLLPATPFAAANRRIAIVMLRDSPAPPGAASQTPGVASRPPPTRAP